MGSCFSLQNVYPVTASKKRGAMTTSLGILAFCVLAILCFVMVTPDLVAVGQDGNCLDCHPVLGNDHRQHFIESSDDCLMCHQLTPDENEFCTAETFGNEVCVGCHVEHRVAVTTSTHAQIDCTTCHAPHGSEFDNMFSRPESQVCMDYCHSDSDLGLSHPQGPGVVDIRTGKEMSCVSTCHSFHSAVESPLLTMRSLDLCANCHAEKF